MDSVPKILSTEEIAIFRERLCDVAEQLFAVHGPDGVTLRELADALGVSSMTPYRYFQGKDAILAAVRTRAFNRFAEAIEKVGKQKKKKRIALGHAYIDFALSNGAAYRLMFDTAQPTFAQYPDLVAAMLRARRTMTDGVQELATKSKVKRDVELVAHMFWSSLHGAVMLELSNMLRPPLDARAIAVPALKMLATQLKLRL